MVAKIPSATWRKALNVSRYSSNRLGLLAIVVTVIFWAIAANVANSLFLKGVKPLELAGASATIATFGLAILDSFFGRFHAQAMSRQQLVSGLILVGLVGADYIAIQQLPVAVAIVLLFTAPILVVLWTALTSKRIPDRSVLIALMLSVVGVILVSNLFVEEFGRINWFGLVIGLSTAVFFAAYILLNESMSSTNEPIGVMLKTYAVASLVWIAYQVTQEMPWILLSPENFPKLLFVGMGGNLLPYLLFFWSIQRIRSQQAAITATLEPLIASVLAWIWFGQTLNWQQLMGGILIIAAITWMQLQTTNLDLSEHP
jgi:drug/metabolite transporter, DME family